MMKLTQKEIERYKPYHTHYEFLCGFNQSSSNMPNITKETYNSFSKLGQYIYELGRECAYYRRVLDRWK